MPALVNINEDQKRDLARKRGRAIKTIDHFDGGICCSLFFNSQTFDFSAKVGTESFTSKDGAQVELWAVEAMKGIASLNWVPVIFVFDASDGVGSYNYGGRELQRHTIQLDVCRYYLAQLPNGAVVQSDWETKPKERNARNHVWHWVEAVEGVPAKLEDLPLREDSFHILPYSEELWLSLNKVCAGIDTLADQLNELVGTDKGRAKLALIGERLLLALPAPKK